jgi:uncharacterized membrane protein YhdT
MKLQRIFDFPWWFWDSVTSVVIGFIVLTIIIVGLTGR